MGAGIAQVAAQSGRPVVLYDIKPEFVERGLSTITRGLQGRVDKGRMAAEEMAAILARIQTATDRDALAPAAVVIEAAPESLALKQELFGALDHLCGPDTHPGLQHLVALDHRAGRGHGAPGARRRACTSSTRRRSWRWSRSSPAQRTDPAVTAAIVDVARAMGKTPVQARDTPGFIVNRVARPFYAEALRMLGENIAAGRCDRSAGQAGRASAWGRSS